MKLKPIHLISCLIITLLICVVWIPHADAVIDPNSTLDQIVDLYHDNATAWEKTLQNYALSLFWILAGIQFVWSAIRLVIKGADLSEWLAEIVNQVLFIGFFLTLLLHSSEWASAIVNSFRTAADQASGAAGGLGGITPSNLFEAGIELARKVSSKLSLSPWQLGNNVGLAVAALIIVISFALMGAFLIVALVESYIVISAGVLFMGFGGSRWTSEYALRILNYAVSVGAKLFVIQLLVGLGERMMMDWSSQFQNTSNVAVFVIVGASIVFLVLTKVIPELVQGLINGSSLATGNALVGMATATAGAGVSAVSGAMGAMGGAGYTALGAAKLAGEQMASKKEDGTAAATKAGRMAQFTGNALANVGKAGVEDLGKRLSGRGHFGNMGGRMGESMFDQAKDMASKRAKPDPPKDTSASSSNGNQSNQNTGNTIS